MTNPLFRKLESVADHVGCLPAPLHEFLERELAAGNAIEEAGTGFPAAPVGVWIRMAKGFCTADDVPAGVIFRERPMWTWPAECTDEPRHFFVLSGPMPEPRKQKGKAQAAPPIPSNRKPRPPVLKKTIYAPLDEFEKTGLDRKVNKAIEAHLGLMWDEAMERTIRDAVGDEGLAQVKEIAEWADRAEHWQNSRSHDRAYQDIKRQLESRYSYLSAAAIERLATRSAWGWR